MARVLNKAAGKVVEKYNDLTRDTAGVLTGPLNKLWRARILLNRATSFLPKDDAPKGKLYTPNGVMGEAQISSKNPVINKQLQAKWRMELQFPRLEEGEGVDPAKGNKNTTNYRNFEAKADVIYQNEVRIYNMTVNPTQYIRDHTETSHVPFLSSQPGHILPYPLPCYSHYVFYFCRGRPRRNRISREHLAHAIIYFVFVHYGRICLCR